MLVGAVALGLPMAARADAPCRAEAQAMSGAKRDPALSPPKEPEAKAHMRAANTHSETATRLAGVVEARDQVAAEYRAAVDEYVAAVKVSASPSLLYNLAQTYRAAGDYPKAVEQYRLFLVRGEPGEPLRNLVECHIAAMTAELDRAASTAPPRGPAPMEDAPPVEPTAPAPAPTSAPAVALEPPHAPALSAPVPWHADGAGWAIAGVGAVAAGVGGYLLLDARSLRADADAEPRDDVRADMDAKADSRQTWGAVTTAAGVAVLAVGIVKLAITPGSPRDTRPRAGVSLVIRPGAVALGGTF
jgi:hypothetical protein